MEKALAKANIKVIYDFPIRCKWGYRIDFAIPEIKLGIECDGEKWHLENNRKDRFRDKFLNEIGWTILRFRGMQIEHNINECINKVKTMLEATK